MTVLLLKQDGGIQYLATATYDSHSPCDDSGTQPGNVATAPRNSYKTIATLPKPRFGPCDQEGFRQVRRGSKPQPAAAPREVHHQSRYALLQDMHDTDADGEEPDSEYLGEHVSYGVQTRAMAKHINHEPTPVPCGAANLKSPVDMLPRGSILSPGKDLLVHRREGHAQSHPDCTSCPMGKLQARRTTFRRPTDPRPPKPYVNLPISVSQAT